MLLLLVGIGAGWIYENNSALKWFAVQDAKIDLDQDFMLYRTAFVVFLTGIGVLWSEPPSEVVAPEVQTALDTIRASSLRDDLKFIASDELQGRDSPSTGLDRAADYIADQFRRAGLEPGVGDSYFQNAAMLTEEPNYDDFGLRLSFGRDSLAAQAKETELSVAAAVDLKEAPVFKLDLRDPSLLEHMTAEQLSNKVVILMVEPKAGARLRSVGKLLRSAKPALLVIVSNQASKASGSGPGRPGHRLMEADEQGSGPPAPRVTIHGDAAAHFYAQLKPGSGAATATVHIAAPHRIPATLRNVIGVLRGADPGLRDQAVLLTAHYDHLGVKPEGSGDRIYNGANDDGSGTVSVMEVARALARLSRHPKRSIVFMTFFGEEEGLIGSDYYAHHPVWPIEKTVADLNLEQVGRTDSTEGRQISNASLTGFDYSDITRFVTDAGQTTGIKIYKNPRGSDAYFSQSDNYSLAEVGVPAETLCVAFDYSDYHAVGDEWQKIDYENMARVDRAVALAMFLMADSERGVQWNESNPKTAPYVKALNQRGTE
jgi:hypothetical protein